jgi:hypothetical protein
MQYMTNFPLLAHLLYTQTTHKGGSYMADKRNNHCNDSCHEGRDKYFMDIDRMMNEGMSGGSVHMRHNATNIEEAHDFVEEEPPHEIS